MGESTAGPPLRVLIVNAVALNAGDAAILEGEILALRRVYGDCVSIAVADDSPAAAARRYPDVDFVPGLHARRTPRRVAGIRKLARSLRRRRITLAVRLLPHSPALAYRLLDPEARAHLDRIRAADVVISTGGTYLVEHYPTRGRLEELLAAQALGRPTYLYTQSVGRFAGGRDRARLRRALRGVERIFVRDERSREHVLECGLPPERIDVCADAAFALAAPVSANEAQPDDGGGADDVGSGWRVAVSVRHWPHFRTRAAGEGLDAYRRAVAAAVRHLHALGAEVTFVSTCQGVPAYWTDDSRFARSLVDELLADVPGVRVDSTFRRPRELVEYLRDFDLAIATRMHFAIFALNAGVPVVPIAYEFKTEELFDGLGMSELVVDIETITEDALAGAIDAAVASRDSLRARIRELLPGLRRRAAAPAEQIRRRHPPRATERDRSAARTTAEAR